MPAMSKIFSLGATLAAMISSVSAHTSVEKWEVGGKTYDGYRQDVGPSGAPLDPGNQSPAWWTNQGWGYQPIMGDKINNADIIAHKDAKPSPYTAEAPAGSKVTFTWHHEGECGGDENGWDCSHHGWTATWLAPCNGDCKSVDKTQLEFFKIHESGLVDYRSGRYSQGAPQEQTGYWGTDAIFYDNNNQQSVTIPSDLPNGNYVLRTEVISIHNNGDISERQFWPQAFNVKITGGTAGASVPSGVKGTEIYKTSDALLQWDLYWHEQKNLSSLPGPDVAACAKTSSKARRHARDFS